MALQHFYSRVPARMSMYNKSDGFDTFAHSEGLTKEFIQRELSVMYEGKLGKNDATMVRKGEISPIYSQCNIKSGCLLQTCITYLPLDFTGERSSYFAHTLVFSEEEKRTILFNDGYSVFNHEAFLKDISVFNVTSPNASPNACYPALEYRLNSSIPQHGITQKYDTETVKSFLCAVLLSLCGKGKNVFFKLPVDNSQLSLQALSFINEIISVLPYNLRPLLSFVTYLSDINQFPNFKLKCVAADCPEIPANKGVFFDFQTNLIVGLKQSDVIANAGLTNFFYELLNNDETRKEFLAYIQRAIKVLPKLGNTSIKVLNELVFLFSLSCGMFSEQQIVPTDQRVYDYFCVYEKYRSVLCDEYRNRVYRILFRYPQNHAAIPKNIFLKVARLYPTEIKSAKSVVMDVVLQLIHTDIMREKLFVFIKNNYDGEDDCVKKAINEDLSRVFYGGFLQNVILEFFNAHFDFEPLDTQNLIIEKLLLSIRTAAIQQKILNFFNTHYDNLSSVHKKAFYNTFFEMLPECDSLAENAISIVNSNILKEDAKAIADVSERLVRAVKADYLKEKNSIILLLASKSGFCNDVVIEYVFGDNSDEKIYFDYIGLLKTKSLKEKTKSVIHALNVVPEMSEKNREKFLSSLQEVYYCVYENENLYSWIEADVDLQRDLTDEEFKSKVRERIFYPAITRSLFDVFKTEYRKDGVEYALNYLDGCSSVCESENYKAVYAYKQMINAVLKADYQCAFSYYTLLPQDESVRANIAAYINACVINEDAKNTEVDFILDLLVCRLASGIVNLEKLYSKYAQIYKNEYYAEHGAKTKNTKAIKIGASKSVILLMRCCTVVCDCSKELNSDICIEASGLKNTFFAFFNDYGNGAKKWLNARIGDYNALNEFITYFKNELAEFKSQNNSFLLKFFRKT